MDDYELYFGEGRVDFSPKKNIKRLLKLDIAYISSIISVLHLMALCPLRLTNCLFPVLDSQPTAIELFKSSLYGSGAVFRNISRLLRHFPSSTLAWGHTSSNSVTRKYCCPAREVTLSFMDTLTTLTYLLTYLPTYLLTYLFNRWLHDNISVLSINSRRLNLRSCYQRNSGGSTVCAARRKRSCSRPPPLNPIQATPPHPGHHTCVYNDLIAFCYDVLNY